MGSLTHADHMALTHLAQSRDLPNVSRWAVRVACLILIWTERSRSRAHLRRLNRAGLKDVGLTMRQARHEGGKWFWRP